MTDSLNPMDILRVIFEEDEKNIKTLRLTFVYKEDRESFQYLPGHFAELLNLDREGFPFGIASSPTEPYYLEFTLMKTGIPEKEFYNLEPGDRIVVRGPLGNPYPLDKLRGKNIVILGEGPAFTTLRSLINYMLYKENRGDFGHITVFFGARTPGLLIYKDDLKAWEKRDDIDVYVTVEESDKKWKGRCGSVSSLIAEIAPDSKNAAAVICGPLLIQSSLKTLFELGFIRENIITSPGLGVRCDTDRCGKCHVDKNFACKGLG